MLSTVALATPSSTMQTGRSGRAPIPTAPDSAAVVRPRTACAGTFVDRNQVRHSWRVNAAHALYWDNAPYYPIGVTYTPKSLQDSAAAAWAEDTKALGDLKAKGLVDLIIQPTIPLADVAPEALQRLLDLLDSSGFRYGLGFGPGITTPLTGIVVKPASYRFADTHDNLTATWQVSNADAGLFILTDTSSDNQIVRSSSLPVQNGSISAPIDVPPSVGTTVALLFPHKSLPVGGDASLPDIWSSFDDYRDRVLDLLASIKFGAGFRFFLDPITRRLGVVGETDYLIPDSPNFRLEWEAYISRKYPNIEEARTAWALTDTTPSTAREFAQLVPLWANTNGVPYFMDMETSHTYRIVDASRSTWWVDFLTCRNQSVQYHMNAMAALLKQIAGAPVVYTWTQVHPIFTDSAEDGGFDGLAVAARGTAVVSRTVGPAYSAVEQSHRGLWCIATDLAPEATGLGPRSTQPAPTNTAPRPPGPPVFASETALQHATETLLNAGEKGMFVNAEAATTDIETWLSSCASRVQKDSRNADFAPRVLFYPMAKPGPAHTGLVPGTSDVLWLNSYYPGDDIDWWPAYSGYVIQTDDTAFTDTVLVSLRGRKETHLLVLPSRAGQPPDARAVRAFAPNQSPIPIRVLGPNYILIPLDSTPTVLRSPGYRFVPVEAAEMAEHQMTGLVAIAQARKIPFEGERAPIERAGMEFGRHNWEEAYVYATQAVNDLISSVQPYIWMEGENSKVNTFTEVALNVEASSGSFLRLSTPNSPGKAGYAARYYFNVPEDDVYHVWLAGSLPGPGTSPIKWKINDQTELSPTGYIPPQPFYLGERFGWMELGTVQLKASGQKQLIQIDVTDRAVSPPDYAFSIDAIMLTRASFTPNGAIRPLPIEDDKPESKTPKSRR